jgi:hypothetical protein
VRYHPWAGTVVHGRTWSISIWLLWTRTGSPRGRPGLAISAQQPTGS